MTTTGHIHWIGAGLASGPGLVSLASELGNVTVWDMDNKRANMLRQQVQGGRNKLAVESLDLNDQASINNFKSQLEPGDIIVSMLPAALHITMANVALDAGTHLVTSSYVDDAMADLDTAAKAKGLAFVNEVGLDPGIDHLFAHILVNAAHDAGALGKGYEVEFVSHCGGIPAAKTEFTYKFSWTPLGVLKALTSPALRIKDGAEQVAEKVWQAVSEIEIADEKFEVYPNRDSLPYIEEYGLEDETNLKTFVRGTLRQSGWKKAWTDIFAEVETGNDESLKSLSEKLLKNHSYAEGEEDRVVLYVALKIKDENGGDIWSGSLALDEVGSGWQTAMARTVSLTVAEAAKAILRGAFKPGVHAALTDAAEAKIWLSGLKTAGVTMRAETVNI